MRVKILTSCAGREFSYYEGEVVDVSAKLGKDLIKAGFAEEVKYAPKRTSKSKDGDKNADAYGSKAVSQA